MSKSLMNLILASSVATITTFGCSSNVALKAESETRVRDPGIRQLQQERLDLAKAILAQDTAGMDAGIRTPDEVLRSASFVAETELELAETQAEIVAVREKQLEIARHVEAMVDKKVATGSMRQHEKQLATYARLGAEIDLLRAKQGDK